MAGTWPSSKITRSTRIIIFPAAAFVEMVLEAGVQLFEGRPFAIEDFEIRKPLILPDPPSGLMLELTYEPAERTFTIQSRFEQAASWSVHVVGSLRSERTESSFAASAWEAPEAGLEPEGVGQFYGHMSDLGLRYGDEFRPIRELAAGGGKSAGRVSLSEAIVRRAGEYALHPGALRWRACRFSPREPRRSRIARSKMKLPVRFARILFLRSPGASSLVRAAVLHFNDELVEGRIALYDEAGRPCVLIDGFRAISMTAARRPGASGGKPRICSIISTWERSACHSAARRLKQPVAVGPPAGRGATRARSEVIAMRGRAELESRHGGGGRSGRRASRPRSAGDGREAHGAAQGFHRRLASGSAADATGLRTTDRPSLAERGSWTQRTATTHRPTATFARTADSAHGDAALIHSESSRASARGSALRRHLRRVWSRSSAARRMPCRSCSPGPARSCWIISTATDSSPATGWRASAAPLQEAARHLPEGRGLRILEVGAGTGGLAVAIAAAPGSRFAFLHFHRCLRRLLPRRHAEAGRLSRGGIQDF